MEEAEYCLPDSRTLLLLKGPSSFILAGKAGSRFPLCIEYGDGEICTTIEKTDIIVVSAPEGGALEPAVMLMDLVRAYHVPLLVLPQGHPGSKRLRYVVSAGPEISLSCGIQRGTHPDQHLLCSSGELAGILLSGTREGIRVDSMASSVTALILTHSLTIGTKALRGGS